MASSTHPRTDRPWNGTCTSEPTPASSSPGRRYVKGRSSERMGRSMQTVTGPSSAAPLTDGGAEVVGAVGRLPREFLAAEVAVRRGLVVDGTQEVEVADDGGGPEVEDLP